MLKMQKTVQDEIYMPCYHQPLQPGAPDLPTKLTYFWGLYGHSEVIGSPGKRDIEVPVWLTDPSFTTSQVLCAYMDSLAQAVGYHGFLIEEDSPVGYEWSPGMPYTYANCTFLGFIPGAFAGQESAHAIPDEGLTLFPTLVGYDTPAWAISGALRWRQLIP